MSNPGISTCGPSTGYRSRRKTFLPSEGNHHSRILHRTRKTPEAPAQYNPRGRVGRAGSAPEPGTQASHLVFIRCHTRASAALTPLFRSCILGGNECLASLLHWVGSYTSSNTQQFKQRLLCAAFPSPPLGLKCSILAPPIMPHNFPPPPTIPHWVMIIRVAYWTLSVF